MAKTRRRRDSKGRFLPKGSRRRVTRRKRARTAYARPKRRRSVAVAVANSPRKRRSYRRRSYRRRSYRRNPAAIFGLQFPALQTVGYTVLGTIGTAYVDGFVRNFIPATITANKLGSYAVKVGSAFGMSYLAGMIGGAPARKQTLIGGMAYVALQVVNDFLPMISPGVVAAPAAGRYLGKVGSQPLLAEYPSFAGVGSITTGVPARLDPNNRY